MRVSFLVAALVGVTPALLSSAVGAQPPSFTGISWNTVGIPTGLLLDGTGRLYATCEFRSGAAARAFDLSGNLLQVLGQSDPYEGYGLVRFSDASIGVADYYGRRVQRFDAGGALLSSWFAGGFGSAYAAVDEQDHIYVADDNGDLVRKFTEAGGLLGSWSSPHPAGIAYADGVIFVASWNAGIVTKYTTTGSVLGSFPTGFVNAEQLAIDGHGRLYLSDIAGAHQLRCFDSAGKVLWTLGSSVPGYSYGPVRYISEAVASDGTLYVGDYDHRRVLVFSQGVTAAASASWGSVKRRYREEAGSPGRGAAESK